MITRNVKVDAMRLPAMRGIELYFYERLHEGKAAVLSNLEFQEVEEGESIEYKGITLPYETAQELIDSLWDKELLAGVGLLESMDG